MPLLVAPETDASVPFLARARAAARGRPHHNLGAEVDQICTLPATATATRSAAGPMAGGDPPAATYTGLHAPVRAPAPAPRLDAVLLIPALHLREDAHQATHGADTAAAAREAIPFAPAVREPARCRTLVRVLGLIRVLLAILGVEVALDPLAKPEEVAAAMTFEIADPDHPRHKLLMWGRTLTEVFRTALFQWIPLVQKVWLYSPLLVLIHVCSYMLNK